VNVNTGDIAWKIPFGIYPELVAKGIPPTGTPNLGGPIATASGLVFIGATKDARFRAYDAKTGKELWYAQLEAAGGATPMTFMGRNGTQYIMIAAGGPGDTDRGGTEQYPQKLVAFALSGRIPATAASAAARTGPVPSASISSPPQPMPSASVATQDEGRLLAERVCTACHALNSDMTVGRTPDAWKVVVEQMIGLGAQATPAEVRTLTEYLSRAFPQTKQ